MTFSQKFLLGVLGVGCFAGAGLCTLALLGALPGGLWLALSGGVLCGASLVGAHRSSMSLQAGAQVSQAATGYRMPKVYDPLVPLGERVRPLEETVDSGLLVRIADGSDPFSARSTEEIAQVSFSEVSKMPRRAPQTPLPDPFMAGPTRQISPDIVRRLRHESSPSMMARRAKVERLEDEGPPSISGVMSLDEELDFLKEAFD